MIDPISPSEFARSVAHTEQRTDRLEQKLDRLVEKLDTLVEKIDKLVDEKVKSVTDQVAAFDKTLFTHRVILVMCVALVSLQPVGKAASSVLKGLIP